MTDSALAQQSPRATIELDRGRWRVVAVAVRRLTATRVSLHAVDRDHVTVVDGPIRTAVLACREFRTLAQHADAILRQQPRWDLPELLQLLVDLVEEGWFESEREVLQRCLRARCDPSPTAVIDHVGVVTCDRPEWLARWLGSVASACRAHRRRPTITVCDDSSDAAKRKAQRATLAALAHRHGLPVHYAGLEEKRAFCAALVRRGGIPAQVVDNALFDVHGFGLSTGANRNALSLAHVGKPMLSMDDDTLMRWSRTPSARDVVALDGRSCPMQTWFFERRQDARDAVTVEDVDPLALFEDVLGQPAPALVADGCDVTHASRSMVRSLAAGDGSVVAVSAGVVGDSGVGDPTPWLALPPGAERRRLLSSRAIYEAAFTSKEVVRGAACLSLSDKPFLMAPAVALDLRRMLPPFPPTGRNQDGVFAFALRATIDDGYIAHLPWACAHEPAPRRYPACGPGFSLDAMLLGALGSGSGAMYGSPCERIVALGAHLQGLGSMKKSRLEEWLEHERGARIAARVRLLEERLVAFDERPRRWAEDVKRQIAAALEFLVNGCRLPVMGPEGPALATCRRALDSYGEVLTWWPQIVAATAQLAEEGVHLAVPLAVPLRSSATSVRESVSSASRRAG
jgi:hypothetical protein